MNPEKARTLQLLRDGMGHDLEIHAIPLGRNGTEGYEVHARVLTNDSTDLMPVLFLISTLAFLEAPAVSLEYQNVDGWTPQDFIAALKFEADGMKIKLDSVRGRGVYTEITLSQNGCLVLKSKSDKAVSWLQYVRGQRDPKSISRAQSH